MYQMPVGVSPERAMSVLENQLKSVDHQRRISLKAVPAKVSPLKVLLMMPGNMKLQKRVASDYFKRYKRRAFLRWLDLYLSLRHIALQKSLVEAKAATKMQCISRGRLALKRVNGIKRERQDKQDEKERQAKKNPERKLRLDPPTKEEAEKKLAEAKKKEEEARRRKKKEEK